MIEFYSVLCAVKPDIDEQMFSCLLYYTAAMLSFGYFGHANFYKRFILGAKDKD